MKILFSIIFVLAQFYAVGQLQRGQSLNKYFFHENYFQTGKKTWIHGLTSDPVQNYRLAQPIMNNASFENSRLLNQPFWTNSVTTMSFNKGKFGTFYYWDMQGNLRGANGFIDLGGRNKRGFKMVFPWRIK